MTDFFPLLLNCTVIRAIVTFALSQRPVDGIISSRKGLASVSFSSSHLNGIPTQKNCPKRFPNDIHHREPLPSTSPRHCRPALSHLYFLFPP